MSFHAGHLADLQCFLIRQPDELVTDRTEFLERYYSMRDVIPPRIALDGEVADPALMTEWLKARAGRSVDLVVPQRGEQLELVKMCAFNAAEYLAKSEQRDTPQTAALDELARLLSLPAPPAYIEAYDISHTAGSENVAGMTVFRDGKPLKSAYRHFKIKSFSGQDDYRSMAEVLDRRLCEYEACREEQPEEGFGRLPDLILLDGGKGQLSAVLPVLARHSVNLPVFGMVKDSKHRTRAIAAGGGDIAIRANRRAYTLIASIQEETHRFAISYHRKRSVKNALTAELESIEGMGPKRVQTLLKEYKTVDAVKRSDPREMAKRTGIPLAVCQRVVDFYR